MKRFLSVLLVLMVVVSAFTGCKNNDAEKSGGSKKKKEKIIRLEIENAYLKELRRLRLQKKLKQKQELPKTSEDNTH